jgi:hypothetical protein
LRGARPKHWREVRGCALTSAFEFASSVVSLLSPSDETLRQCSTASSAALARPKRRRGEAVR